MKMKTDASLFVLFGVMFLATGCKDEIIETQDRNNDGVIDQKSYRYPGTADRDWSLIDTNYDGVFDLKVTKGVGVFEEHVVIDVKQ
jgi:hypothetical protein